MRVFARYDRKVRDEDREVDVVIEVRPGALYRFGKLTITGLDIEGEAAVKKRWIFALGDPFNGSYPNAFLKRIRGMFDNLSKTDSKVRINEQEKTIDVEFDLPVKSDRPPTSLARAAPTDPAERFKNGELCPSDQPGLGFTLTEGALKKHTSGRW